MRTEAVQNGLLQGLLALVCLGLSGTALAESWRLGNAEWSRPRSGETVLSMTPVREAVRHLNDNEGSRLELVYPGGEPGELWAAELRDWLVALAVDADSVTMHPGAPSEDELLLRVRE